MNAHTVLADFLTAGMVLIGLLFLKHGSSWLLSQLYKIFIASGLFK